jgi:membrane fusion protein, copper/silver efflux system
LSRPAFLLGVAALGWSAWAMTFGDTAFAAEATPSPPVTAHDDSHAGHAHPDAHSPAVTQYVCPMHPQIIRDEPGTCPICGMDLVEKRIEPMTDRYPPVSLTSAVVQTLGVRTAVAERGLLWRAIRTLGRVTYDETRLAHVHPRASGWIEALDLRAEGEPVKRGQTLAEFYAPDILSAQIDFLLAREGRSGARIDADKARNLLRLLAVPDDVISAIERDDRPRNRIPVRAPMDGIVTRIEAREGMYVTEATEMFRVADLSRVWVMVDVYEHQIDWLKPDAPAEIRVPARPGRTWNGRVDYLYPELDPDTRTLRVRLVFDNPDLSLKPNMFADVEIFGGPKRDVLKIPAEALIVTGARTSVVQALGDGRFQPVDVVSGMQRDGVVEILSGLEAGDRVVTSGQFLIDSESNLRASFQRLGEPGAEGAAAAAHSGHGGH